jgi:5-bromo-4-chloroindolyl phosphate hydrolysis protein
MSLYAGTIYGWLFFGLVFVGMVIRAKRQQTVRSEINRVRPVSTKFSWEEAETSRDSLRLHQENLANTNTKLTTAESALTRMKELQELRSSNLISEAEYQEKRAEILKSL